MGIFGRHCWCGEGRAMPCETPWGELAWAHDIPVSEQDQLPRPPQTPGGTQLSVLPQPADDDDFDWEEVKHCRSVSRLGTTDGSLEPSSFAPSSYATPSTFGMQSGINENPHKGAGSPLPSMPDGPATPSMRHLESASSSSCCSTPAVVREKTPPKRTKPLDNRRKSIPLKPNFIKPPASPSLSLSGYTQGAREKDDKCKSRARAELQHHGPCVLNTAYP